MDDDLSGISLAPDRARARAAIHAYLPPDQLWYEGGPAVTRWDAATAQIAALTAACEAAEARAEGAEADAWAEHQRAERMRAGINALPAYEHSNCYSTLHDDVCECGADFANARLERLLALLQEARP